MTGELAIRSSRHETEGPALSRRSLLQAAGASLALAASHIGHARRAFAGPAVTPFSYRAPQSALDDLRRRLEQARWPERETVDNWSQGVPLEKLQALVEYWRTDYDWRRCEATLNSIDQYFTEIDGLDFHFLHVRSPHADALPLLITHGWPGSVIEFFKIIDGGTQLEAREWGESEPAIRSFETAGLRPASSG